MERQELLKEIEKEFGIGCALVCKERARQKEVKGFDQIRDNFLYEKEELAQAAIAYAVSPKIDEEIERDARSIWWPWDKKDWNPTPDNRQREFEKSGALIAAQIDVTFSEKLQTCESCGNDFDIETMSTDAADNYFCAECWKELAPVMKADYDELVAKGEIDPEE